jgi:hypothetical protein
MPVASILYHRNLRLPQDTLIEMPSAAEQEFKTIQIQKLHPTFGAELSGINYSKPIPDDIFQEIRDASAKVCASLFSLSLLLIC